MLARVRAALAELPERDVRILALHFLEEMTFQDIATVLGITPSRVCQLMWRAVARLRRQPGRARPPPQRIACPSFDLLLPRARTLPSAQWPSRPRRGKSLIVEDDPDVSKRRSFRTLHERRHGAGDASDPFHVLAKLEAGTAEWDVMLLDVGLPGIAASTCSSASARPARSSAIDADRRQHRDHRGRVHARRRVLLPDQAVQDFELLSMVQSAARYSHAAPPARRRASSPRLAGTTLVGTSAADAPAARGARSARRPGSSSNPDPGRERHRQGAGRARAARPRRAAHEAASSRSTAARSPRR